jgi:hypothetical protein
LFVIVGALLVMVVGLSLIRKVPLLEMIPLMLVLLMSAVPVALPVMFTISMAVGSKELAKHGVLVTRLSAAEDGATMDVLCVDKTGTITMNQLAVTGVIPRERATEADVLFAGALASQEANQIFGLVGIAVGVFMGLGAIFAALNTMYSAVSVRAREIATLRAIGFGAGSVVVSVPDERVAETPPSHPEATPVEGTRVAQAEPATGGPSEPPAAKSDPVSSGEGEAGAREPVAPAPEATAQPSPSAADDSSSSPPTRTSSRPSSFLEATSGGSRSRARSTTSR